MEIQLILGGTALFDAVLLLYLLIHPHRRQPFLLLAAAVSLLVTLQSLLAYREQQGLVINHYGQVVALYAWLLYLQSLYLQIPNRPLQRYLPLALVNLLLFSLFLFQLRIDQISGDLFFDTTTLLFAGILTSIAMLFFLENLIRHLRAERRYAYKHLLFALILLALIHLLYFHQLASYREGNSLLLYLMLMVLLPLPVFVGVSMARIGELEGEDFSPGKEAQAQYFMILIGAALLVAGIMQMLDYYFSEVRSDFYHAMLISLLLFGGGFMLLSNLMRTEINQWLRAYFLGDATDYKREWDRVSKITREEEGIEARMLDYFLDCLGCDEGALYLADRQRLVRAAARGTGFDPEFRLHQDWHRETEKLGGREVYCLDENDTKGSGRCDLLIPLAIGERIQGLCRIRSAGNPRFIDDSVLALCDKVSNEFAIRLGEIQQKLRLQRQEKLAGFNRTVAFLAHDLKNIVAQQKLAVENFPRYRDDPEFLDDFCETIEHSTQKLEDLIAQFRYKSLNSRGETVSFRQLIDFLHKKRKALGHRLRLDLPLEEDGPALPADLLAVLDNLIKNAFEASPETGSVEVSVEYRAGLLALQVCDHGEGMTAEFIRDQLFEPFTSTKTGSGLGIGMYHVRNIVDALKGHIEVASRPGEGTCITVETPIE